jgi:hypothetical protein
VGDPHQHDYRLTADRRPHAQGGRLTCSLRQCSPVFGHRTEEDRAKAATERWHRGRCGASEPGARDAASRPRPTSTCQCSSEPYRVCRRPNGVDELFEDRIRAPRLVARPRCQSLAARNTVVRCQAKYGSDAGLWAAHRSPSRRINWSRKLPSGTISSEADCTCPFSSTVIQPDS